jgi:CRISPR-associated protein Cmr5
MADVGWFRFRKAKGAPMARGERVQLASRHTRDQRRALYAYEAVGQIPKQDQDSYKIAINDLGANILRGGLAASMAALERLGDRGSRVLEHLAGADVPGLEGATKDKLPNRVCQLEVDSYMVATREMLAIATWLKRAAQATFGGP